MRPAALLFAAILTAVPVWAQSPQPSSTAQSSSASQDGTKNPEPGTKNPEPKDQGPLDLPVSLDKIREALKVTPVQSLRGLNPPQAQFKVEIKERRKIEDLLSTLDFKSGPPVPGGLYAFEQQRLIHPSVDNPLAQPYAAFNSGQLLTLAIEGLIEKYLAGRALNAVTTAEREHAEAAARAEVARAIADFCALQPNRGAAIKICQADSSSR